MSSPSGSPPGPPAAGPLAVLSRVRGARPQAAPGERCDMCAEPLHDDHNHVVNITTRSLLCTCRPCYLLFDYQDAQIAYRAVPDRYLSFPEFALTGAQWDELQIPVGMAFFFDNSELGRTVAFYPGPAGAAESELGLDAWDGIVAANPGLRPLLPDVEALLVRAQDGRYECFLVPIDVCYELVGRLRTGWRGFDGGQEARAAVAAFFVRIRDRARPAVLP